MIVDYLVIQINEKKERHNKFICTMEIDALIVGSSIYHNNKMYTVMEIELLPYKVNAFCYEFKTTINKQIK